MAITKSAKKAIRNSEKKAVFNLRRKRLYKNEIKEIISLLNEGKIKEAEAKVPQAYKLIDKAAKMNTIHKNAAARTKSRLVAKIKKVKFAEKK